MAMSAKSKRARASQDAVTLLKADHQLVKDWFEQFKKASGETRQSALAQKICHALRLHTILEEEIFYPAFFEATHDKDLHHEAEVEHNAAKELIAQIEQMAPQDDYFHATVNVLGEMIKHHVREEEKAGGMFAEAKKAKMDLVTLGERITERKLQLESEQKAA